MDKQLPGKDTQFTGSIKQQRHLLRGPKNAIAKIPVKYKKLGIIVFVAVLVLGVIFRQWYVQHAAQQENKRYAIIIKQADDSLRAGDQKKAQTLLEGYLTTNPKDEDHLYNAEIRLASIYVLNYDYRNARLQGEAALKHTKQPTLDAYIVLGESCQRLKDNKAAIEYYSKAVELLKNQKSKSPGNSAQIQYLNASIASLESEGQQ